MRNMSEAPLLETVLYRVIFIHCQVKNVLTLAAEHGETKFLRHLKAMNCWFVKSNNSGKMF